MYESRCDFVDANRYGTDCGPACPKCGQAIWLYQAVWSNDYTDAKCVSCHHVEAFTVTKYTERSIAGIKDAHVRAIAANNVLGRSAVQS